VDREEVDRTNCCTFVAMLSTVPPCRTGDERRVGDDPPGVSIQG
jgi:hypothetical protein